MCTVSWVRDKAGYSLFFNRDELRSRKPAAGPELGCHRGIKYIAPRDGDFGGTWIGVNHFGLILGLLNRFDNAGSGGLNNYTSRGLLLRDLLDCSQHRELAHRVSSLELNRFRPFTLFAVSSDEPAMLIEWNGLEVRLQSDAEDQIPLSSSSLKQPDVVSFRKDLFDKMRSEQGALDFQLLADFHRSHVPERGPQSICMHRDEAVTVSLSVVTVTVQTVEFHYYPTSPCQATSAEELRIERVTGLVTSSP